MIIIKNKSKQNLLLNRYLKRVLMLTSRRGMHPESQILMSDMSQLQDPNEDLPKATQLSEVTQWET